MIVIGFLLAFAANLFASACCEQQTVTISKKAG